MGMGAARAASLWGVAPGCGRCNERAGLSQRSGTGLLQPGTQPGHWDAARWPPSGGTAGLGAPGARGAGACCPRGGGRSSFPYKDFGRGPSGGSRVRLRLPHSSAAPAVQGLPLPSPGPSGSPASPAPPPAAGFEVGGCVSLLFSFRGVEGGRRAGGAGVPVFARARCWLPAWGGDAGHPGCRTRVAESGSPSPVLLSPPFPRAGASRGAGGEKVPIGCPTSPPPLSLAGPRMSSMFGKPRAGGERPPQSPLAECNVAILGCRGAGKSGEMGAPMPRGWMSNGEGGCAGVLVPWGDAHLTCLFHLLQP